MRAFHLPKPHQTQVGNKEKYNTALAGKRSCSREGSRQSTEA